MTHAAKKRVALALLLTGPVVFTVWLTMLLNNSSTPTEPQSNNPRNARAPQQEQQVAKAQAVKTPQSNTEQAQLNELSAPAPSNNHPKIVIILDDIGNQWDAGTRSVMLDGDVTLAILPFSPYAQKLAELATQKNKEVMLHAPMEPVSHQAWNGGLTHKMTYPEVRNQLLQMLNALPQARGVNNHMGSALTQNQRVMGWVMETLAERNLYFVDSRTSAATKALTAAQSIHLPSVKRDIFLDNQRTPEAIEQQLQKLVRLAKTRGYAVGIGHPYPETLAVLERFLIKLKHQPLSLVKASTVINQQAVYSSNNHSSESKEAKSAALIRGDNLDSKSI